MSEAQTGIIPLNQGSLFWDGCYNMTSSVINMVIDLHGRLLSIPTNELLIDLAKYTTKSIPVNILAIVRTDISKEFNKTSGVWKYTSTYLLLTTKFYPVLNSDIFSNQLEIRVDEATNKLVGVVYAQEENSSVDLSSGYINRPTFSYTVNLIEKQILFIDDIGQVCYVTSKFNGGAPSIVEWSQALMYSQDSNKYEYNTFGADIVEATSDDGSINYTNLFWNSNTNTVDKYSLAINLLGYGILYNETQSLLVLTDNRSYNGVGGFNSVKWQANKYPIIKNKKIKQKGVPLVKVIPVKVIDMQVLNSSLFLFTETDIYRYNLTITGAGNPDTETMELVQDLTFNYHFSAKIGGGTLFYKNVLFFMTQDNKFYSLNSKGVITELTKRGLPGEYYFRFNYYENATGEKKYYYFPPSLQPLSVLNMDCISINYTLYNLENNTYSYLVPNIYNKWDIGENNKYEQPAFLTATSNNGKLAALGSKLVYMSSDYKPNLSSNYDYYSNNIIITSPLTFEKAALVCGIQIVIKDSNLDPHINETYSSLTIGLYPIVDIGIDMDLLKNWNKDEFWISHQQKFYREYSTNTFIARFKNISCQSLIFALKFNTKENNNQKMVIDSIKFNYEI